jgi:protein-S-isoprenylcysteine O-methyltransferase Ste14
MIFPTIFVLAFLVFRPSAFVNDPVADKVITWAGIFCALLGCALRLAVIGFAYIVRGGKDKKVYADGLVTGGFYAHCRNPMYTGNILIASGIVLIYGSIWMLLAILPFFVFVYLAITAAEEEYLRNKFGAEFTEYCARVPRFLVNPAGLRKSLSEYTYDWRKVLIKEYGTTCSTLAGIILLLIWKRHIVYGLSLDAPKNFCLSCLLIPIAILYLSIRYLKKSGKLKAIS